jgi:hypothetical protein
MEVDFGRAVTYPFDDTQWVKKIGILLVLGFIPGLGLILWSGYALTVARNMVRNNAVLLPDWKDWSDIAVRGFLSLIASFGYFLPAIMLSCCVNFGLQFAGRTGGTVAFVVQCCSSVVILIYGIAASLLLNAGHVQFAITDQYHSYIEIGALMQQLRSNTALYVTLFAVQTAVSIVAIILAVLLAVTCLAPFALGTMAYLVNGYFLGATATTYLMRNRR